MDDRTLTATLAGLRAALGVGLVVAPGTLLRPWVGPVIDRPGARTLARAMGARDAALGVGALLALRHGSGVRGWLEGATLADLGDVAATVIGWRHLPSPGRALVLVSASSAVGLGVWLARRVDRPQAA